MTNPRGVDLSHHNDRVDFGTLKAAGTRFVALKATEGPTYTDPTFFDRRRRARQVGFEHLLFYHFLRPDADPKLQALHFAEAVGGLRRNEAVVVDVEAAMSGGVDAWSRLSPKDSAAIVAAFVYHLKTELGLSASDVILYGSLGWLRGQFGPYLQTFAGMPLWAARYADALGDVSPWKAATIWQYSDRGSVRGAGSGDVDLDVWLDAKAWGS